MAALSNYLSNRIIDWLFRQQSFSPPTTTYIGLITATRGSSSSIRSAAVTSGDTVIPATPNGHIYSCSTSGTTASGEPTWPTTAGATVTDGTAVWTEQTTAMNAGTIKEPSSGAYARQSITSSLANWAGTQSAGSTSASSGTSDTTSNNNAITFPAATGNWGTIWGIGIWDASSGGNACAVGPLSTPQAVPSGITVSFSAAQLAISMT